MNWSTDYESELVHVFEEAERRIDAYPAPLNAKGRAYLQAFNPLNPSGTKNHICYLLPFWMKPVTVLPARQYRDLSLANVFVMLYFFTQDDLMDTAPEDWKEQLALGNLFHLSMLELYRGMFDSSSPFWEHYREYVTNWSLAVAYEKPFVALTPSALALKAAPVKLASTGALYLAGRQDLEIVVSEAVDLALATLQYSDDWADWEEDFDSRNANSLISMIVSEEAPSSTPISKKDIQNAIYIHGALSRFSRMAEVNCESLESLQLPLPHLAAFQENLARNLVQSAEHLERNKRLLLDGGFSFYLSTQLSS
ncbi:hypothetical protein [Paenibacillus sacheonensis]|uniref:Uncharacterized protein n=1 Tax=Paenibacillus sacheonensis TaxID=742054 RepID=A0A7X4YN05_9BACL|nr:hypothetical protein [Paenibacillus sacheonensis]MBM7564808.1 hypothetical protein [Paenibacillus sacheonensis]NBC69356.1 hypothetical protein [Paenibacillus sacheonensis]